eukprot:TRINITY_DN1468_c0_g1_i1.p1 TRINITY_DN1468_c0_g1~~TRINITY_DN1468_c0_g1_i1.p1  ORF type:complete len:769 (+),score=143.61 TRINITY_DN1468_c0_g1_i1:58-2364(+)
MSENDIHHEPLLETNGSAAETSCCTTTRAEEICVGLWFSVTLVVMVVVLVLFGAGTSTNQKVFSYQDLFNSSFSAKRRSVSWLPSGKYAMVENSNGTTTLKVYTVSSSDGVVVVNQSNLGDYGIGYFSFSPSDENLILLAVSSQKIWRHSFMANYLLYNVSAQNYTYLGKFNQSQPQIRNAVWNPVTTSIAYVHGDNIYIQSESGDTTQVTNDASIDIIYGVMDWLYEEEVFSDYNAMWWSPDGTKLAYLRFNDTGVSIYSFDYYEDVTVSPYTSQIKIKYPKSGTTNPLMSLMVYDTVTKQTVTLDLGTVDYITDVMWRSNETLLCRTMDRMHHVENMTLFNLQNVSSYTKNQYVLRTMENGWLPSSPYTITFVQPDMNQFVMIDNNSGYFHIGLYNTSTGKVIKFFTEGQWDVLSIDGYDPTSQTLYYMSSEVSPTLKHLYSVSITTGKKTNMTSEDGYYSVQFSQNGKYFVRQYNGPSIPHTRLYSTDLEVLRVLEDNSALKNVLSGYNLPTKSFVSIPLENRTLNAYIITPPIVNPSLSYGLLYNIYGGPGSQTVTQTWTLEFNEYVASNLGIYVVSVDPRGTGARGIDFMQQTYLNLGKLEAEDMVSSREYLLKMLLQVDPKRTAIWGWSYGGYLTLTTLLSGAFSTGISVAPVTDWRFYDTFYTESFMQTPQTNPSGYNSTSVLLNANALANATNQFLLVHGTGDDNVHFQNTVELNKMLIHYGVQYETMFYANRDHGISGDNARQHLYKMMSNFLSRKIGN